MCPLLCRVLTIGSVAKGTGDGQVEIVCRDHIRVMRGLEKYMGRGWVGNEESYCNSPDICLALLFGCGKRLAGGGWVSALASIDRSMHFWGGDPATGKSETLQAMTFES